MTVVMRNACSSPGIPSRAWPLVGTLLTLFSQIPCQAQEQALFTFDIQNGATFIETLRIEKTVVIGNGGQEYNLSESQIHCTITKTENGYSVYVRPVRPVDLQVSEISANLAAGILANMRLRYDLDSQGNLIDIAGIEQAFYEMENIFPDAFKPIFEIMGLNPSSLRSMAAYEWRIRGLFDLAQLSGQTIPLGSEIRVSDALFPSAIAGFFRGAGQTRSDGPLPCDGKTCIVIESVGATNDPSLGDALAQYARNTLVGLAATYLPKDEQPEIPQMQFTDLSEQVRYARMLDPDTGMMYSITQENDVRATIRVDGDEIDTLRILVTRHYTYDHF